MNRGKAFPNKTNFVTRLSLKRDVRPGKFLAGITALLIISMLIPTALAAISLSTVTAYTQNFDGIGTSAVATLPADFRVDKNTTVRTVGTFALAGTATEQLGGNSLSTTATNGIYNFGAGAPATATDRAVGFLSSAASTKSGNLYAQFTNNTGQTLNGLKISYDVEKYRNGSNAAGFSIHLYSSLTDANAASYTSAGASFLTSFPADADNSGFASAPGATSSVSNQTLSVSIPNGTSIYLAWNYSVTSGSTTSNAQALGIDNISVLGTVASPVTYTWMGPTLGVGDYNLASNWTPARVTPAANDILVINTGFTPTLTNVPTQTIGALLVTNTTSATLTTSIATNTLTISGGTNALEVDAGSALTLADVVPLKLSIASGSTGTVLGLMLFQDSGHRVIGNAAGAVTFQNGALCTTASNFTGNAFGTGGAGDGVAGSIVFASGAKYIQNGGGSPFGTSGNPAVTIFQTGSEAVFLTTGGFQASGRTYADLTAGNAGTTIGLSDGGAGNFQFDNLTLKNNSTLTFNGTGASSVTIQGNIVSEGSGATSDVTLTSGTGGIILNKAGTQTFSGGGGKTIAFNGAGSVSAATTLALARVLIQTDPTILTVNGALTRTSGYVIGNLQKPFSAIGAKTFEVGTANGYSPVIANVTALGVNPSSLRVRAIQTSQPMLDPAKSLKRYWTLTEIGDLTADLTFNYLDPADIMGNEAAYRIIKVEGGAASNLLPPQATVNTVANTATALGVSSFSDWTLAEPLAPTGARVAISGRVADAYGRGIGRVLITMLDVNTNQTRTTRTGGDGNYTFADVPVGGFYVIDAATRRYTFAPATQSFTLTDAMQHVNFTATRE